MKILSKYTKTKDITNVENITQKEYLESLASNAIIKAQAPDDYLQPFTYEQWYNRNEGIISGQEHKQYELYLKNWNATRYTPIDVSNDLKKDYIAFLQNLTLVVDKNDATLWLNDIDWTDTLEVEQAIPIYAKKLKEIVLYLINKRESLKKAKLKYNMTGSTQALERLFYEYFLKAFTKRDYSLTVPDQELYATFPELSAVNNGFQIQIEELYDDTSYFDKNPTQSSNFYFDLTSFTPETTGYYNKQNIQPENYEWLFRTGFNNLSSDNPLFFVIENLVNITQPASAYIDMEEQILNQYYQIALSKKYIGENQYYATSGYYIPWTRPINYNLIAGNNWFYWPSGEYIEEANILTIDPLPLINTNLILNGAVGSSNYLNADKIFIRSGNTVSGAWLKYDSINTQEATMSAGLYTKDANVFKFPFPGYGVSGEDIIWTGKQLSNLTKDYEYLETEIQDLVRSAYWTDTTIGSSICAINIHDTNLIDNGATAGLMYDQADTITIRTTPNVDKIHDIQPNELYQDFMKHAWLYQMETTDIPIVRGQNYINWPIERYDINTVRYNVLTSQCSPIALSTISINNSFVGARAGYNLFDSDIIYKLDKPNGTPIECAFLSGSPINMLGNTTFTANATGIKQPALCLYCVPNSPVTFIWTDENTPISAVNIQHKDHQPDCPYLYEKHHSLYTENPDDKKTTINYHQWQTCECKAIEYSPLGHAGTTYEEYGGYSDIIYLDTLYPIPFNKTIWVGSDNKNYKHSKDFAWFQLSGNTFQSDVGWGKGKWVTGDGSEFIFTKGQQYKYLRNDLGHSNTYLIDKTVPNLIVKVPYSVDCQAKWVKAVANSDGSWESFDEVSDMVLNPKDSLVYDHIDSNWYCITSIGDLGPTTVYLDSAVNLTDNRWINYDFMTSGNNVAAAWPNVVYTGGPTKLAFELQTVYWNVRTPASISTHYTTTPEEILNIYADQIGSWTVNVTGVTDSGVKYIYPNIGDFVVSPQLATPTTSGALDILTVYADTINMSINVSLSGWNYNTNKYDGTAKGGRPFWAIASDENNKTTKHKGIDIWGGGIRVVDDYVLITQPEFSDIEFNTDTYIKYVAKNNLNWVQPVTFNVNLTSSSWCDLYIDTNKVATLSSYLYNIDKELIVSASELPSTLILQPLINELPVFVNYYANKAFTWSEILSDTSLGLPPTGGVFIDVVSGLYLKAELPYVNLTNRHYPTIATVAHVENLYSTKDSGGYFIPRMLGVTTTLSKNGTNNINGLKIRNNGAGTNAFEPFINMDNFTQDNSISKTDGNIVIENLESDASWMKAGITNWTKAGNIIEAAKHQQFIPYKTKYEAVGNNEYGIHQQNDPYDPWVGTTDSTWENTTDWPTNLSNQNSIDYWYTQFPSQTYQVYQWKTDIFNNQYALLKDVDNISSIYDKKHTVGGNMWVRNGRNIIQPVSSMIPDITNTLSALNITNVANNILDIDLFYDTLMYYLSSDLLFFKLVLNYDTGEISTEVNETTRISLDTNNLFGGSWQTENKTVTICQLLSSGNQIRPILTEFDINNNKLTEMYNTTSINTNMSAYSLTTIEHPMLTYNTDNKTYNVSYIAYGNDKTGMYLNSINIKNLGETYEIVDVKTIIPDA